MNTPIVEHMDFLKWNFPPEFLSRYQHGLTFKKSWTVRFTENEALFFGARAFSAPNLSPSQVIAAKRVVAGTTLVELSTILSGAETADMVAYFERNGLIRPVYQNEFIDTAWEKQVEYFTDFVDDPNAAQRKLLDTSVCVIGCGGSGNIAVQHLVAAGVQKFVLIDGDRVEKGNFNRQFCFDYADLDYPKVEGLKDYILARNPAAIVHTFCQRIENSSDLAELLTANNIELDVVLCCADTPPIEIHIFTLEHCIKYQTICVFGGVGVHHGHFGPLLVETSHMKQCLAHKQQQLNIIKSLQSEDTGTGIIPGSISYLNTISIALMVGDLIELLAGIRSPSSLNRVVQYDAATKNTSIVQEY